MAALQEPRSGRAQPSVKRGKRRTKFPRQPQVASIVRGQAAIERELDDIRRRNGPPLNVQRQRPVERPQILAPELRPPPDLPQSHTRELIVEQVRCVQRRAT